MVYVLWEKTEMVPPFKTDGFPRQRHVAPLKLRHVAAILFFIFFKKNIGHPFGPHGGTRNHPHLAWE